MYTSALLCVEHPPKLNATSELLVVSTSPGPTQEGVRENVPDLIIEDSVIGLQTFRFSNVCYPIRLIFK